MKKINGGYQSLFEFLVVKDFPLARYIDSKLYPSEHQNFIDGKEKPYYRRFNETPKGQADQFIGALQPLASIANDFQYTLKPYKSFNDFKSDAAQPLRGFKNILRGLANIVAVPLLFVANTVRYALISGSWTGFMSNMRTNLIRSTSWMIDGLSSLIRGGIQLITTPLNLLFRLPIRLVRTEWLKSKNDRPKVRDNEEIQRLVALGDAIVEQGTDNPSQRMEGLVRRLHQAYEGAVKNGQYTDITTDAESRAYSAMSFRYGSDWVSVTSGAGPANALAYLGLFKPQAADASAATPAEPALGQAPGQ